MDRLQKLEQAVRDLYNQKNDNRSEWAEWLADNHVFIVADYATDLAKKYGANVELARVAALLHDIADAKMNRKDLAHAEESLHMARELMQTSGYNEEEIQLVVEDAVRFHSCHDGQRPESLEGRILATADSLAHLKTDFYVFATWALGREMTLIDYILYQSLLDNDSYFITILVSVSSSMSTVVKIFNKQDVGKMLQGSKEVKNRIVDLYR